MIRNKYIVNTRNKLAELAGWFDSCQAIDGCKVTESERETLQKMIRKAVDYMDDKLFK